MTLRRIALPLASAAAALALAACSGGNGEETPPAVTNVETMGEPVNMTELPTQAPAETRIDNTANEGTMATTPPDLSADERTQQDADAAGMTSRVDRDVEVNQNGQPVQ